MTDFVRLKWDRFHVSQEALNAASLLSSPSGFQQDAGVEGGC